MSATAISHWPTGLDSNWDWDLDMDSDLGGGRFSVLDLWPAQRQLNEQPASIMPAQRDVSIGKIQKNKGKTVGK